MQNRNEVIRQIKELARRVLPADASLLLYGSRARGDAHSESDWDLLILLDKNRVQLSDYDNYSYPFRELGWDIDQMISPIIYTKNNWQENSFTPFYKNVEKDKIVLQ